MRLLLSYKIPLHLVNIVTQMVDAICNYSLANFRQSIYFLLKVTIDFVIPIT